MTVDVVVQTICVRFKKIRLHRKSVVSNHNKWCNNIGSWNIQRVVLKCMTQTAISKHASITLSPVGTDIHVEKTILGVHKSHENQAELLFVIVEEASTVDGGLQQNPFSIKSTNAIRIVP